LCVMTTGNSTNSVTQTFALHTITSLPLDPHFPLYEHYPAMKLGVRESVRHYANLLAPLAATIMASQPGTANWVLMAPPLYVLPSGANLLAWEISRLLSDTPPHNSLRTADLRYSRCPPGGFWFDPLPANGSGLEHQDLSMGGEYSSSGIAARIANRKSLLESEWAPKPDPADFQDRSVLVINDTNVTGTQQHFLQRMIETLHPASIQWLYIIQVDPALGHSNPELEYSLNHLNLNTFEDFAEVVARADIDYTSRCVSRLLRYPEAMLEPWIRTLEENRRKRLHQLIIEEGAFLGEKIRPRVALLEEAAVTP